MSVRSAEWAIACDDRGVEGFGEGHVHRVVGRHVLTQFPGAERIVHVAVPGDTEPREIRDGMLGAFG